MAAAVLVAFTASSFNAGIVDAENTGLSWLVPFANSWGYRAQVLFYDVDSNQRETIADSHLQTTLKRRTHNEDIRQIYVYQNPLENQYFFQYHELLWQYLKPDDDGQEELL